MNKIKRKIILAAVFFVCSAGFMIAAADKAKADVHASDGPDCVACSSLPASKKPAGCTNSVINRCDAWCRGGAGTTAWCEASTWDSFCSTGASNWYNNIGYQTPVECCKNSDCGNCGICDINTHTCGGYKTCDSSVPCGCTENNAGSRYCRKIDNGSWAWTSPLTCEWNNFCQTYECGSGNNSQKGYCGINAGGSFLWLNSGAAHCPYSMQANRYFNPSGDSNYELTASCLERGVGCDTGDINVEVIGPQASTIANNFHSFIKQNRVGPGESWDNFLNNNPLSGNYWTRSSNMAVNGIDWNRFGGNPVMVVDSTVCTNGGETAPGYYDDYYHIGSNFQTGHDKFCIDCWPYDGNFCRGSEKILEICQDSCDSGKPMAPIPGISPLTLGGTRNVVACYHSTYGCNSNLGNVTAYATWTETPSPENAITLALGANTQRVTAIALGSEKITAVYAAKPASYVEQVVGGGGGCVLNPSEYTYSCYDGSCDYACDATVPWRCVEKDNCEGTNIVNKNKCSGVSVPCVDAICPACPGGKPWKEIAP